MIFFVCHFDRALFPTIQPHIELLGCELPALRAAGEFYDELALAGGGIGIPPRIALGVGFGVGLGIIGGTLDNTIPRPAG